MFPRKHHGEKEEAMKTILLADDESNLRMLVHTTLEDPQYRILEAADGLTALELLGGNTRTYWSSIG